ncbi:MAG: hypothetical protein R3A10_16685 [Caldilineaceae bacterium]
MATGTDGTQHAVWNVVNPAGHGVAVYYAGLPPGKEQWQEPVVLEEGDPGGLGVMHPAIVAPAGCALRRLRTHAQSGGAPLRRRRNDLERCDHPVPPARGRERHAGVCSRRRQRRPASALRPAHHRQP